MMWPVFLSVFGVGMLGLSGAVYWLARRSEKRAESFMWSANHDLQEVRRRERAAQSFVRKSFTVVHGGRA